MTAVSQAEEKVPSRLWDPTLPVIFLATVLLLVCLSHQRAVWVAEVLCR